MNQNMITPAQNPNRLPSGAIDVWSQGGQSQLGMPAPQQQAPASPLAIAQRLLRGRIALAIVLACIGAIIGAAAGWVSQPTSYLSHGIVMINPVNTALNGEKTIAYYEKFMFNEALKMASPAIVNEVPKYEPWKSLVGNDPAALSELSANVKPTYLKNSFTNSLDYLAPTPELASAGVQSIIKAYQDQYKQNSGTGLKARIEARKANILALNSKLAIAEGVINEITAKYGVTDLESQVKTAQSNVEETDKQLRVNENNYTAARNAIEAIRGGGAEISLDELAQVDPVLGKQVADLQNRMTQLQLDEKSLGANHRTVQRERIEIGVVQAAIDEAAKNARRTILAIIPDFVHGGNEAIKITPGQLRILETRVATLRDDMVKYKEIHDRIASDAGKIAFEQTAIKKINTDLTEETDALDGLNFQAAMTGDLTVMQDGSYAAKAPDKKIMFALAGAMGGAMVPVAILMLLGLMDTRFRYSDDAAGQSMAGIPLLGILPNLPDRLSDPAQASIAAHCVHQIRTMLQLNAMGEHSTVFAITSASSGDGKTSLSLALGLSFAASGSRTLLIDADLVGGGLTSRLGNSSAVGIVDALAGVGLEECVQPTDVADLSLLPIGGAQAHHAGSFSPPAVRRMLAEVRKHYEVIIVDTGPIMGSIEATPIAASVDGVVLTVARGQSRPLVERAIAHLNSVGARVAGVVFNRAQHKDFEQSIGAISIRSAARSTVNGTGHNARGNADMGAVAKAVATSVRSEN